jgi:hypothetical protein
VISLIEASLTIEERRQSLYAALLRYAPEAGELRERALERLVMAALLGATLNAPFRIGTIAANIRFGAASVELRTELIQGTVKRLCVAGFVVETGAEPRAGGEGSPRIIADRWASRCSPIAARRRSIATAALDNFE